MSINEQHQAPGEWDIQLEPGTPEEVLSLSARFFSRLIITPAPVDPMSIGYADLLDRAHYSGVLMERSDHRLHWHGHGLAVLLGDDGGSIGNTWDADAAVSSRPFYDGSNTSWVRNQVLRPGAGGANGITAGTITSGGASKPGKLNAGDSPRKLLDHACRIFGKEWRVNPDGTLDARTQALLWPTTTTPTAAAIEKGGGREMNLAGLPNIAIDEDDDVRDYSSDVTANDSSSHSGTDSVGTPVYFADDGADMICRRVVTASNANSDADCAAVASRQLARFDAPSQQVDLSTDTHDIEGDVAVGDTIFAFAPSLGLFDTSNQRTFDGQPIFPVTVRVHGAQTPCRSGWGYYLRSTDDGASFDLTDLTPYVVGEDGPVTLEVGTPRRRRGVRPPSS